MGIGVSKPLSSRKSRGVPDIWKLALIEIGFQLIPNTVALLHSATVEPSFDISSKTDFSLLSKKL